MNRSISRRGLLLAGAAVAVLPRTARATSPARSPRRSCGLSGPSIEIDPTFSYYLDRSVESVADEIAANGYRTVHYFVVNERSVNGPLIKAFRARGIAVWALVVGNGSYSVDGWPSDWPDWQMQLLKPIDLGGFHFFSPFSHAYVDWKKQLLAGLVRDYPFDGLEIAEPYFPEWNGIASGDYGDVGPLAQAVFQQEYGLTIPDFTGPSAPDYYHTDTARYQKWIQFRVDAVNRYLNELFNGPGGVRATRRDVLVGTWSLGIDAGPDSVALEREYQGLDAGAMIDAVRPDVHIIQTNWPDWVRPDLPADYVRTYQPFVDQIRAHNDSTPIGVQADIGSQLAMARDDAWIGTFDRTIPELGLSTWTAYEYHIGGYMYDDPPEPKSAIRHTDGTIEISFQKRIDAASAMRPGSFTLITSGARHAIAPSNVAVDGNRVILSCDRPITGHVDVGIANVTDAPNYWLYNTSSPAHTVPTGSTITVPPRPA